MSMRRAAPAAGIVALIVAVILALGLTRWPVQAARVGDSLYSGEGLHWALPEAASFRALPWPSLRIYGVRLDASGANLLTAPEARLDLSMGNLLCGRFVATRMVLTSPIVTVDLNRSPFVGADGLTRAISGRLALAALANVSLADGLIRLVDAEHGFDTVLEDVQGRIDGLAAGQRIRADLSAFWRGAPIVLSGSLASLEAGAEGRIAGVTLAVASPVGELSFVGGLRGEFPLGLAGDLTVSSPAVDRLVRLLSMPLPAYFAPTDFSLAAKVKAVGDDLTLNDVTVGTGGQTLQGALRITKLDRRTVVSGTLDAERLAIGAIVRSPLPWLEADSGWDSRRFGFKPTTTFDADLRVSVGALDVYGHELRDAAASLMLKGGEVTATLIDATAYGGRVEGEARLVGVNDDLDVHARMQLSDFDFGAALADFGWPGSSGRASADLTVATTGWSPAALVERMIGTASLRAQTGAVDGANLEEALRRSQRRPLDSPRDWRAGQTAFELLELEFLIGDGVAHVAKGQLEARAVGVALGGSVSLANRNLDLRIKVQQNGLQVESPPPIPNSSLILDVQGPWASPVVRANRLEQSSSEPQ